MTRADLADKDKGLPFTGTGFTPEESAKVTVVDTTGKELTPDTPIEVNEDGELKGTYYFTTKNGPKDIPLGDYSLFLTDSETEKKSTVVEFEVVDEVTTSPSAPAPSETASATPSTPVTTPAPTESATPSQTPSASPSETPTESATPTETATPTESATPSERPTYSARPPIGRASESPSTSPSETPTPTESPEGTPSGTPSETAAEKAQAESAAPVLSIDPKNISSENFTASGGGVSITVENVAANETVTLVVQHAQGKVEQYATEKTADENGRVVFGVKGEGKPVLGQYNVTASSASTDGLNGSFTVTTNDPGATDEGTGGSGGSGGSGSTGSGNSALPRTGADATGLALGAGLLVLGTAAIIVTRRRTKASEDPSNLG